MHKKHKGYHEEEKEQEIKGTRPEYMDCPRSTTLIVEPHSLLLFPAKSMFARQCHSIRMTAGPEKHPGWGSTVGRWPLVVHAMTAGNMM